MEEDDGLSIKEYGFFFVILTSFHYVGPTFETLKNWKMINNKFSNIITATVISLVWFL